MIRPWTVKLRPPKGRGLPFRTVVFAESRPLAIQVASLTFDDCLMIEPPKVFESKPEEMQ